MSQPSLWNQLRGRNNISLTILAMVVGIVAVGSITMAPSTAHAFQKDDKDPGEKKDLGKKKEPGEKADGSPDVATESFLTVVFRANGFFFGPVMLLVSFILVALIIMNAMQIRREVLMPTEFVSDFEERLSARDYQSAYDAARNDESFVARVLAAGLSRMNRGFDQAIEGMQEVGEEENMVLEHKISYLALIGAIAPMIGLMGTVWGMIGAFEEIATSSVQPKPKDLAENIFTALFTTLEGLFLAIPAIIAHNLLHNRMSRLVLEVGMVSEGLMHRFSNFGKTQSSDSAAGGTVSTDPKQ